MNDITPDLQDLPEDSKTEPLPEVVESHRTKSIDKVSGFVEESRQGSLYPQGDKKRAFLELYRRFWPNVSKACALAGMDYRTYKSHLELDIKFKQACETIKAEVLDELEELGAGFAKTKGGFMHWIATLKAHRPERWSPDQKIVIQHELSGEALRDKRDNLAKIMAVDAEVIEATTGRKPPALPEFNRPENEPEEMPPDNPAETSHDLNVAKTAPEIPTENQQGITEPTNDPDAFGSQRLDSVADSGYIPAHEDVDVDRLLRASKPPPKKPTGGVT